MGVRDRIKNLQKPPKRANDLRVIALEQQLKETQGRANALQAKLDKAVETLVSIKVSAFQYAPMSSFQLELVNCIDKTLKEIKDA